MLSRILLLVLYLCTLGLLTITCTTDEGEHQGQIVSWVDFIVGK